MFPLPAAIDTTRLAGPSLARFFAVAILLFAAYIIAKTTLGF
jgi:hypothetical protein